jgi:hypothetical protein
VNAPAWSLLRDYLRRTGGAWLFVAFLQVLQTVTFWAAGIHHVPLLGTVLASFIYAVAAEKPRGALQYLPLRPVDAALFRWWSTFGLPALVVLFCTATAWMMTFSKGWQLPAKPLLEASATTFVVVLGLLSATGAARIQFTLAWVAAAVAGLIGLPVGDFSRPLLLLLGVVGFGLSIAPSVWTPPRRQLQRKARSLESFAGSARGWGWARGWGALLFEVGRTTALVCVATIAATAILHAAIPPRAVSGVHGAVIWLFTSAVAAATCLPMRRWVEAVGSFRILPLDGRWLALVVYLTTMTPGVVTCLVVIGAQRLSPRLDLDIPWYMLIVFLLAPITLVRGDRPHEGSPIFREWVPAIQQAAWSIWAGSFCALRGVPYMPAWFLLYLSIVAAVFVFAGYKALLAGIRSPAGLESHGSVLLERA